jgi:short-subunit dehydrogenase
MAFAEQLAGDGYDVIIVARRRERLEALAQRLRTDHGAAVEVFVADLTNPAAVQAVEQRVAEDTGLELLVNNAGFAGYMPFVQLDPDRAEELIRVHVIATTRVTRAALPGMLRRGRGAIINVSSLLGFSASVPSSSPMPRRAVYAGCKAYINTFTEVLHHELEGTGVQVQALCPGPVQDTEFHDHVPGFDRSCLGIVGIHARGIVRAALTGLELGEVICVPGLDDPDLIAQVRGDERQMLARAAPGGLAARYTEQRP